MGESVDFGESKKELLLLLLLDEVDEVVDVAKSKSIRRSHPLTALMTYETKKGSSRLMDVMLKAASRKAQRLWKMTRTHGARASSSAMVMAAAM